MPIHPLNSVCWSCGHLQGWRLERAPPKPGCAMNLPVTLSTSLLLSALVSPTFPARVLVTVVSQGSSKSRLSCPLHLSTPGLLCQRRCKPTECGTQWDLTNLPPNSGHMLEFARKKTLSFSPRLALSSELSFSEFQVIPLLKVSPSSSSTRWCLSFEWKLT